MILELTGAFSVLFPLKTNNNGTQVEVFRSAQIMAKKKRVLTVSFIKGFPDDRLL